MKETVENTHLVEEDIVFQHDRDPKHIAKSVQNIKYLTVLYIKVISSESRFKPQNPDLNLIKNLWSLLKKRMHELYNFLLLIF